MILFVETHDLRLYPGLQEEIFALRSRGLQSIISKGSEKIIPIEKDDLDDVAPSYILCLEEETGAVLGSLRILQTMGPHALSDIVQDIDKDEFVLRSPCLWEISRVCTAEDPGSIAKGYSPAKVVGEMLVGAIELARRCGVTDYVVVMNENGEALATEAGLIRSGNLGRGIAGNGGVPFCADVISCNEKTLRSIRQTSGIEEGVWADDGIICRFSQDEESLPPPAQDLPDKVTKKDTEEVKHRLQTYCANQLLTAKTEEERCDAYRFMRLLNRFSGNDGHSPA